MTADLEAAIREPLARGELHAAASSAVRGYGPEVLGYLRALLPASDADDAFSIWCEFLWKQLPQYRGEAAFRTWAYHLAWGAARRVLEDAHRRRARPLASSQLEALAQEVRSTTAVHLRQDTADRFARIRGRLTPDEQTLLVLRIDRDLPWADVATVMEQPEAALRKRLERLKDKIRRLAAER
jgi:RNA polymerase sigma-70 factor (ECF subfamily)